MSYEERIRRERSNMSKSFAKLADFLLIPIFNQLL